VRKDVVMKYSIEMCILHVHVQIGLQYKHSQHIYMQDLMMDIAHLILTRMNS